MKCPTCSSEKEGYVVGMVLRTCPMCGTIHTGDHIAFVPEYMQPGNERDRAIWMQAYGYAMTSVPDAPMDSEFAVEGWERFAAAGEPKLTDDGNTSRKDSKGARCAS